jgi:Bifunctional DNA primase/polymerase, N-terminal
MRTNRLRSNAAAIIGYSERKGAGNALATARGFLARGWQPLPVPRGQKSPELKGWPQLEITASNIGDYFDQRRQNIGVKLGTQSGGLTDIDLDCVEAVVLADELLPETSAVFGRESKRSSHWLYVTDLCKSEQKAVIKFVEPPALACDPQKPATVVELRIGSGDKGTQTLFPGSIHPSGELIEWDRAGEPAYVDGDKLKRLVGALAAGALLARHYPATGARHDAALVLGGVLARIPDMQADDIDTFVTAIARAADDDEAQERGRSAAGAVELLERGDPTPGLPRMRELWGTELADTAAKWLNFREAPAPDDELIDKLARLKLIQYDQQRSSAAATLGIRAVTLDKVVAGRREELESVGAAEFLPKWNRGMSR